jgi:hypothetical protein
LCTSEHRRRHGIPDDDKRPWHEAYPAALDRRRPLLRRPIVKEDTKPAAQYHSAYDPYGRTIKDHFILEENARGECDSIRPWLVLACLFTLVSRPQSSGRTSKSWKKQFGWAPLQKMVFTPDLLLSLGASLRAELSTRIDVPVSAKSSVAPDVNAKGERVSRSPSKRIPSLHKSGALSLSNGVWSRNHSQPQVPSHAYSGSQGAPKANGRKRLYMDPRRDESQSGGEETDDDRAAAFSLPKRQRVNTWGTDSQANVSISPLDELAKLRHSFNS